jgi:hypothetical protein
LNKEMPTPMNKSVHTPIEKHPSGKTKQRRFISMALCWLTAYSLANDFVPLASIAQVVTR